MKKQITGIVVASILMSGNVVAQKLTVQGIKNSATNVKNATKGSFKKEDQGSVDFLVNGAKSGAFNVGEGTLTMQVNLPQSFQFYDGYGYDKNVYDNGEATIFVKVDGQPFRSWGRKIFDTDYKDKKQFDIPVVPANDKGINNTDMKEHNIVLADEGNNAGTQNSLMMAMLAQLYDKMPLGKHTMDVEVWTSNYDAARNEDKLAVAVGHLDFELTAAGRDKLRAISVIELPKHKEVEFDKGRLAAFKADWDADGVVATDYFKTTDYLYHRNSYGIILNRTYNADILLKSDEVCWWVRSLEYLDANEGGDKYGSSSRNAGSVELKADDASVRYVPIPCNRLK